MKLPAFPYGNDKKTLVKFQALVSDQDKDLLMTIIPDRNLYTLFIQHALKRTADYIRYHDLEYNPNDQLMLLEFITSDHTAYTVRGPAAARTPGKTHARDVVGRETRLRESLARVQDKSADVRQGGESGPKEARKGKVVKDRNS